MNDKKNDLIRFLLVIVISLFTAFVGKIVAMYFGFKAIYGILIGLFVPVGIITMSTYDSIRIKEYLGSMGLACVILIVPTLGLSILFGPLIIGIIFIIMVAIRGLCETPILLQNFLESQLKNNKDKKEKK